MTKTSIALHILLTLLVAALVLAAGVYCHLKGYCQPSPAGVTLQLLALGRSCNLKPWPRATGFAGNPPGHSSVFLTEAERPFRWAGTIFYEDQMNKIRPLHDRVILKRIDSETTTPGGLHIPDNAKEIPSEGHVVAVGNGKVLKDGSVRALEVKAGDHVLFGKFSGVEMKLDGEEHLMVREEEILGVVES